MRAGTLKEKITLLKPISVRTATGSEDILYQPDEIIRAKKNFKSGSRVNENGEIIFDYSYSFEVRWFASLNENYHISYNNQEYRILNIEKVDYNQSLIINVELVNE